MALGSIEQLPHQKMLSSSGHSRLQQHLRPIAPASTPVTTSTVSSSYMSPNRSYMPYSKLNKASITLDSNHPSVVRRNARERNRVKQVNNGFLNLRQHIPQAIIADLSNGKRGGTGPGANKKLSKVNTLRMALEYIRLLQSVIDEVDQSDTSSVSSYSSRTSTSVSLSGSSSPSREIGNVAAAIDLPQGPAVHVLQRQQESLSIQQHSAYYQYNFADSISRQQQQQHQQQHLLQQQLISPAASTNSSISSSETSVSSDSSWSALFGNSNHNNNTDQHQADHMNNSRSLSPPPTASPMIRFKFEPKMYEEYQAATASDDEELLDYISLWQDDI